MILHFIPNHPHALAFVKNAKKFFTHEYHIISIVNPPTTAIDYTAELNHLTANTNFARNFVMEDVSSIVLHSLFFNKEFLVRVFGYRDKYDLKLIWGTWGGDYLRLAKIGKFVEMADRFDALVINRSAFMELQFPKRASIDNDIKFYLDVVNGIPLPRKEKKKRVMLGNSGDSSNNHAEILDKLDIAGFYEILIPLGYNATNEYVTNLKGFIKQKFKNFDRFTFLNDMIQPDQYSEILRTIDLLILAQDRQQGINTARQVYFNGGTVILKKIIESAFNRGEFLINPGWVALNETGCHNVLDFNSLTSISSSCIVEGNPSVHGFYNDATMKFFYRVFENRWLGSKN